MKKNVNDSSGVRKLMSPFLRGRLRAFLENYRLCKPFDLALLEDAFSAGVEAKASEVTERNLKEDLARCSVREVSPVMVMKSEPVLPPFEVALMRMADLERSDEWSYNPKHLESDSGVLVLALLYERPVLEVAMAVANTRREWVKRYLAKAG